MRLHRNTFLAARKYSCYGNNLSPSQHRNPMKREVCVCVCVWLRRTRGVFCVCIIFSIYSNFIIQDLTASEVPLHAAVVFSTLSRWLEAILICLQWFLREVCVIVIMCNLGTESGAINGRKSIHTTPHYGNVRIPFDSSSLVWLTFRGRYKTEVDETGVL